MPELTDGKAESVVQPFHPVVPMDALCIHLRRADAGSMDAFFKKMRFARDACFVQCLQQHQGIFHRDRPILHSMPDEHRRRAGRDLVFQRELLLHGKVRTPRRSKLPRWACSPAVMTG